MEEKDKTFYDPKIWQSTSNKYKTIARLPEGMSGIEALKVHAPEEYKQLQARFEDFAANTFRRKYAKWIESCHVELTQEEWDEFKANGGYPS